MEHIIREDYLVEALELLEMLCDLLLARSGYHLHNPRHMQHAAFNYQTIPCYLLICAFTSWLPDSGLENNHIKHYN